MGGLIDQLREDFPDTVGTRIQAMDANVVRGGTATSEKFAYADPNFLDIVRLPIVAETRPGHCRPRTMCSSAKPSRNAIFPGTNPIGQTMTLTALGKTANYRVAGIFRDLPPDTELSYSILARTPNPHPDKMFHWGSSRVWTILRLDTPQAVKDRQAQMRSFVDRRGRKDQGPSIKNLSLRINPITDIHLQSTPGRKMTVATLGIVAY